MKHVLKTRKQFIRDEREPVPFDEVLHRLVNAPPQHKPSKPSKKKKPAK